MSLEPKIEEKTRVVATQKQPIYKTLASLLTQLNKDKFEISKPTM